MTAHTAVVFTRYMMLSLESRESNDIRSLGALFVYISDEMADITWLQALQMLLQLFRSTLSETAELTEYSCAMKSHFRKFGNQMSGSGNHLYNYASLLA